MRGDGGAWGDGGALGGGSRAAHGAATARGGGGVLGYELLRNRDLRGSQNIFWNLSTSAAQSFGNFEDSAELRQF